MEYEKETIQIYDFFINTIKEQTFNFNENEEKEILKEFGKTKEQIINEFNESLLIGLKNGYSVEFQINLVKKIIQDKIVSIYKFGAKIYTN